MAAPMPMVTLEDLQRPAKSNASKKVYELLVPMMTNATDPMPPLVLTIDWRLLFGLLVTALALSALLVAAVTARAFRGRSAGRFTEVGV